MLDGTHRVYEERFHFYRELLALVGMAHGWAIILPATEGARYRAYVGPGNNSGLIKKLLARRFWWTVETTRTK